MTISSFDRTISPVVGQYGNIEQTNDAARCPLKEGFGHRLSVYSVGGSDIFCAACAQGVIYIDIQIVLRGKVLIKTAARNAGILDDVGKIGFLYMAQTQFLNGRLQYFSCFLSDRFMKVDVGIYSSGVMRDIAIIAI